jgi:hypothetical protein
LGKN